MADYTVNIRVQVIPPTGENVVEYASLLTPVLREETPASLAASIARHAVNKIRAREAAEHVEGKIKRGRAKK